ncbi:MAG: hypothetical protein SFT92_08140 [Rickettsiales bacterium]|nr:hypothetical protein [Rickettsiales bacterium]
MSENMPACRREEVALCQPDRTVLVEQQLQQSPVDPKQTEASEKQTMSEKQFMWDHSLYSAISSWLFAIAGATNIGVLGVLSSKVLSAAEQGKPIFKSNDPAVIPVFGNKKFNRIALAMTAFGGVCMAISNWLESKKVVTEWQLGAGKLQRKVNGAEREQVNTAPAGDSNASADMPAAPSKAKSWVDAVETKIPNIEGFNSHFRPG